MEERSKHAEGSRSSLHVIPGEETERSCPTIFWVQSGPASCPELRTCSHLWQNHGRPTKAYSSKGPSCPARAIAGLIEPLPKCSMTQTGQMRVRLRSSALRNCSGIFIQFFSSLSIYCFNKLLKLIQISYSLFQNYHRCLRAPMKEKWSDGTQGVRERTVLQPAIFFLLCVL